MREMGPPHVRGPGVRRRGKPASPPLAGTSEHLADSSAKPPAGRPAETDAADNAFWISSTGYQIVQLQQAAERQRAEVLAEAQAQRPDLAPDTLAILADQGFPLTVPFGATPEEVLAYLDVFRPTSAPPSPKSWRRLRLEQALEQLRQAGDVAPTQATIAEAIWPSIAERTLRGWLAAEPELRALLPRRPRNRGELPESGRFST